MKFPTSYATIYELEYTVDFLWRAPITSYENIFPVSTIKFRREAEWWNAYLEKLRNKTRAFYNGENKPKLCSGWVIYKMTEYEYSKNIWTYKQGDERGVCKASKNITDTARLHKILPNNIEATLKLIRLDDGEFSEHDEKRYEYKEE